MGLLKDFKYHAPATIQEALKLLQKSPTPLVLAGGTFVLNYLKKSVQYPTDVISLKKIESLKGIKDEKKGVSIGALTTIAELLESSVIKEHFFSLYDACQHLATTPLRNMATIGGNLASRFYWVDLPAVLISLGAKISLETSNTEETVSIEDFLKQKPSSKFILTSVFLPKKDLITFYFRHTKGSSVDVASLALAFSASKEDQSLESVRFVVNTASSFPVRLKSTEAVFEGETVAKINEREAVLALQKDLEIVKLDEYRRYCLEIDLGSLLKNLKDQHD